ncbi:hypothetical protein NSTC745_02489 [Nostoc sp. DSM 114161]|jgi:hypothetical protein
MIGVLVFLGQGLRISVLATRNFTCKTLQRFIPDILRFIKLYSNALKYGLGSYKTENSVYRITIIILLSGSTKNNFLYFLLGFAVCMYIYVFKYRYRS